MLVPTCFRFPSKNRSKLDQNWNLEGIEFLIDFCIDFFIDFPSIWGANLELCWPLRLLQEASKTPPRRLPRRSARHFSLLVDFWSILGRFLIDFGWIFGWFSIDFGSIWCWFLKGFGALFSDDFSWFWVIVCLMFAPARWRARSFAALWIFFMYFEIWGDVRAKGRGPHPEGDKYTHK